MKFALIDNYKTQAEPGLSGICPSCNQPVIAKCGEIKIWHWAHRGRRRCDPWWENETAWHREWKDCFPVSWQEFVCSSTSGEKHIADVITSQGWTLEFQHSPISPDERQSREDFYPKLVWVVDGLRRKRDIASFDKALKNGHKVKPQAHVFRVWSDDCTLVREWSSSRVPVFFDFGHKDVIWWLLEGKANEWSYVSAFFRSKFIGIHIGNDQSKTSEFEELVCDIGSLVREYESNLRTQKNLVNAHLPLPGTRRYTTRRPRKRW